MISKKVQDKGEPINSGLFLQARYQPTTEHPGDPEQKQTDPLPYGHIYKKYLYNPYKDKIGFDDCNDSDIKYGI